MSTAPTSASTAPAQTTTQPATAPTQPMQPQGQQPQGGKTEAQAQRMMRLKVEGQELELPESEVIALAQQGKQAGRKFQEAAQMRREAEALAHLLKSNPKEALSKFGIDVRKFSEETLVEMLKREQETPEQKTARENEEELKRYRDEEKKRKEEAEQKVKQELEEKHLKNYTELFVKALSESGLPKTTFTVKRMAELQLVNLRKGLNLDASRLAEIVREDYISEQKALFGASDGNTLMELLGPDAVKKLSKAQIAKLKATSQKFNKPAERPVSKDPGEKALSWKEIQRRNLGLK